MKELSIEEKSLLLKDLCARLPYKVRCKCINGLGGGKTDNGVLKFIGNCNGVISNYYEDLPIDSGFVNNVFYPIENIKPYLRSMSSITEEEKAYKEFNFKWDDYTDWDYVDWLNAHHFDYHGLSRQGFRPSGSTVRSRMCF